MDANASKFMKRAALAVGSISHAQHNCNGVATPFFPQLLLSSELALVFPRSQNDSHWPLSNNRYLRMQDFPRDHPLETYLLGLGVPESAQVFRHSK
jgi:hypothetical protein